MPGLCLYSQLNLFPLVEYGLFGQNNCNYRGIFCTVPGEKKLTCSRLEGLGVQHCPKEKQSAYQGRKY